VSITRGADALHDGAAMEPADWREHKPTAGISAAPVSPQWSPPLNGGSTRHRQVQDAVDDVAAMEPTVGRREHFQGALVDLPGPLAAMEPATGQREYDDQARRDLYLVIAAMEPAV
jgi:hypothetical protein